MMKEMTINEVHAVLLDIAKDFHRVCEENNIPYYMLGGTMLGAVRHENIIPWDDDMDFGIPRGYYERAVTLLRKHLNTHHHVVSIDDTSSILSGAIKIEDNRTVMHENMKTHLREDELTGVFIDVFPLDHANRRTDIFSKNIFINLLTRIEAYRFIDAGCRPLPKKIIACVVKVILAPINRFTIIRMIEKRVALEGNYFANHYGAWGMKEIISKKVFGTPKLYKLGDSKFYGVQDADAYLKHLYGDYMKLPSEEERHTHIKDVRWK